MPIVSVGYHTGVAYIVAIVWLYLSLWSLCNGVCYQAHNFSTYFAGLTRSEFALSCPTLRISQNREFEIKSPGHTRAIKGGDDKPKLCRREQQGRSYDECDSFPPWQIQSPRHRMQNNETLIGTAAAAVWLFAPLWRRANIGFLKNLQRRRGALISRNRCLRPPLTVTDRGRGEGAGDASTKSRHRNRCSYGFKCVIPYPGHIQMDCCSNYRAGGSENRDSWIEEDLRAAVSGDARLRGWSRFFGARKWDGRKNKQQKWKEGEEEWENVPSSRGAYRTAELLHQVTIKSSSNFSDREAVGYKENQGRF